MMPNSIRPSKRKQEGIVIVIALFIIALVATMSYVMMARLDRDIDRTTLLLNNAQLEGYAQGSIVWAMDVLQTNFQPANRRDQTRLTDELPLTSPKSVVNGFTIVSTINDMQAKFNINNLMKQENERIFVSLLKTLLPKESPDELQAIGDATKDWLAEQSSNEELDKYYLNLPEPYRAAHKPMAHVSELLLVKGMTPAIYKIVQPYLCALAVPTALNVQTIPIEIMASLDPKITRADAETIIKKRPFIKMETFTDALGGISLEQQLKDQLTVRSDYFIVETNVANKQQKLILYTLLKRDLGDGKVKILWQSKGVM